MYDFPWGLGTKNRQVKKKDPMIEKIYAGYNLV